MKIMSLLTLMSFQWVINDIILIFGWTSSLKYSILCKIQMGPICFVACMDSCIWSALCLWTIADCVRAAVVYLKPDFIRPNGKHIYTVWIIPYLLYSALHAIQHAENSKCMNKWSISAAASMPIYNVRGGALQILESSWLDRKSEKLKCNMMSSKSLIHISRRERL